MPYPMPTIASTIIIYSPAILPTLIPNTFPLISIPTLQYPSTLEIPILQFSSIFLSCQSIVKYTFSMELLLFIESTFVVYILALIYSLLHQTIFHFTFELVVFSADYAWPIHYTIFEHSCQFISFYFLYLFLFYFLIYQFFQFLFIINIKLFSKI